MRGKSGIGSSGTDNFWRWRDEMYSLAETMTEERIEKFCYGTFLEMLEAGITTVGEFHYLHHGCSRFSLDEHVLKAATEAGIRIVLIQTFYERAGFTKERSLSKAQEKFVSSFEEYARSIDDLCRETNALQTIAMAAHSLRGVSVAHIKKLFDISVKQRRPIHIHIEEQPREIEDCQKVTGQTPSEIIITNLKAKSTLTAVHCTFTSETVMRTMQDKAINICICPLTEGFLGDGIPNLTSTSNICLGTDCNNRLSMLEEMRALAYYQHIKHNLRSYAGLNAKSLLCITTINGAKSLGIEKKVGSLEIGKQFDFVAFNLHSTRIADLKLHDENLLDAIIFGSGNEDISMTAVSGVVKYQSK